MDWRNFTLLILVLCFSQLSTVKSSGLITIRLLRYDNPSGTDNSGECCGGINIPGCPTAVKQCNHYFDFCIGENETSCSYGKKEISAGKESNSIVFDPNNPNFEFTTKFQSWKGLADIRVTVSDKASSSKDVTVDNFQGVYNGTVGGRQLDLIGNRTSHPTNLSLHVKVSCETDYYGPECDVYCKEISVCNGHYTCDAMGQKVCKAGWTGADCETMIVGGPADCNVYTGRKDFVPGLWKGTYQCEDKQMRDVSMNVSHNSGSILAKAVLTIPFHTVNVQGTYLPLDDSGLRLILEGALGNPRNRLQLVARQINSSFLIGDLTVSGINCTTTLSLYESYFDGCIYADKCIRYGAAKNEYFCCCGKGSNSIPCASPTTQPPSTAAPTTKSTTTQPTTVKTVRTTKSTVETTENTTPASTTTTDSTTTTESTTTQAPTTTAKITTHPTTQAVTERPTTEGTTLRSTKEPATTTSQPETTSASSTLQQGQTTAPETTKVVTEQQTTKEQATKQPTTKISNQQPTTLQQTTKLATTEATALIPSTNQPTTEIATTEATTFNPTTKETTSRSTVIQHTTQQPTTKMATTEATTATKVETTLPTTQAPFNPSKLYTLSLNIVKEEFDNPVFAAVEKAWIDENEDLNLTSSQISVIYHGLGVQIVQEGDSHRGYEVCTMKYKIVIEGVNAALIREPSDFTMQEALKMEFDGPFMIYHNKSYEVLWDIDQSFSVYVYGPGPRDDEMDLWQNAILTANNMSCGENSCENFTFNDVQIKMTEEFVSLNGGEVTRVYFYIFITTMKGASYIVSQPNTTMYEKAFKMHGIDVEVFTGNQDNIDELKEYRFHYDLFVKGEVSKDDVDKFEMEIDKAWKTLYPEDFGSCRLCNTTVVRTESYVGANGEYLTAIVYFFKIRIIWEMPLYRKPHATELLSLINVSRGDNSSYQLYLGAIQYRYSHCYNVLIDGKVDNKDSVALLDSLKGAWRNFSSPYAVSRTHLMREYYTPDGRLVTDIIYHISYNNKEVDARLIAMPTTTFLSQWFRQGQNVSRKGGSMYTIHTGNSLDFLYWIGNLWSVYIDGFVMVDDRRRMEKVIRQAFNLTFNGSATFGIKYISEKIYVRKSNKEIVSRLMFTISRDGQMVSLFNINRQKRLRISEHFRTVLLSSSMSRTYTMANMTSWFDLDTQFELFFTTKIATLDYSKLMTEVSSSLRTTWTDYSPFKSINIYFFKQDKVYLLNRTSVWRVSFFLTSGDDIIDSRFVVPIASPELYTRFRFIGINTEVHHLYTGQRSSSWLYYSWSFTLTFKSMVSEYDWLKLQESLSTEWCKKLSGCANSSSVRIWIGEQIRYIDSEGHSYYRLVYFVKYNGNYISHSHYLPLSLKGDYFTWKNVYGSTYKLHVDSSVELWRYSYAFHLYLSGEVRYHSQEYTLLLQSIAKAWYSMNASDIHNCSCLEIIGLPMKQLYTGSESTIWQLTYFIRYKKDSHLIDATVWPKLDISLINYHYGSLKWLYHVDYWYYRYLLHFYSNHKVSITSYGQLESAMKKHWLKENKEYQGCGCIDFKIRSQEEVFDRHGNSHWMLHYHIMKNGKPLNPSSIRPFNWATFNHTLTTAWGQRLQLEWSSENYYSYVRYRWSGGLYVRTWVPPSLYGYFGSWLQWYYGRYYKDSNVTVTLMNKTKEFKSKEGESLWQIPFILSVNGTAVNPPPVNSTEFELTFNTTAPNGKTYKTANKTDTTDTILFFSVHFNRKVSDKVKANLSAALINSFVQQHPDIDPNLVNISFGNQEEVIDSENKKGSWQLLYTISVNGTKLDTRSTAQVNTTLLKGHLKLTSPDSGQYIVVDVDKTYTSSRLFSLYFTSYVSVEDRKKVEAKIQEAWKKQYNKSSENVTISFVRQKQLINSRGEAVWKWDYIVQLNNQVQRRVAVIAPNQQSLSTAINRVVSVTGGHYNITDNVGAYFEYAKHFGLYLTSKVTTESFAKFKAELESKWTSLGWTGVNVSVVEQEELVHKDTGKSTWKLVYFLKKNAEVVDSRLTDHLKGGSLPEVRGPRGVYAYTTVTNPERYVQYEWSGAFVSSAKFGLKEKEKLRAIIKTVVQENITDSELKRKVDVEINRLEEYQLKNGTRGWRVVYFVKLDGQYTKVTSLKSLDTGLLQTHLANVTGPRGDKYVVLKPRDLEYRFRDRFILHFTSEISSQHLDVVKEKIKSAWISSVKEYQNCSCLEVELLSHKQTQEVIDEKWTPYWQLTYFLKKNGTVVESMTHVAMNTTHLNLELSTTRNQKGHAYKVSSVTEDKVKAISLMFSFQLNYLVGFNQREVFQQLLARTWMETRKDYFRNSSVKATINRMLRYIDVSGGRTVWQIDYSLHQLGVAIDPLEVPMLNLTELQAKMNFKHPTGKAYKVMTRSVETAQLRYKFQVFMDRKVRGRDLSLMAAAVERYVATERNLSESQNLTAVVPVQEGFIDSKGNLHWSMAVLLRTSEGVIIDSRSYPDFNLTALQSHINVTGVNGIPYTITKPDKSDLTKYYLSFAVMVTNTVRRSDMMAVSSALSSVWKETGFTTANLSVKIRRQEQYISKSGPLTKLVYYVTAGNVLVNSDQLDSSVNKTKLNQALITAKMSHTYRAVEESGAYTYSSLYSLVLTEPVLLVDKAKFEMQLGNAWADRSKGSYTVQIMSQEELVLKSGKGATKVLYVLNKDARLVSAVDEDEIEESRYKSSINLTKTGTSRKYVDGLVNKSQSVGPYEDLFQVDMTSKVDVSDYSKIQAALLSLWNRVSNSHMVSDVKIAKQESVITKTGEEVYRLLYAVTSSQRKVTRRLEVGPSPREITSLNVTNKQGDRYTISTSTATYRSMEIFSFLVNRQIYETDSERFEETVSSVVKTDIQGIQNVSFEVTSKKKVISQKSARIMWQYSFVVSSGGAVVQASLYPRVKASRMNSAIKFKSPREEQYIVENDVQTANYDDLFTLDLKGHHSNMERNTIRAELVALWNASNSVARVPTLIPEEYIDEEGGPVTRYRYMLEVNSEPRYPNLMVTPDYSELARRVSLTLHVSGKLHKYSDCYRLYITRLPWQSDSSSIQRIIEQSWNSHTSGETNYSVAVVKQEDSVGRLGVSLSTVLYTATKRTGTATKRSLLTPDFAVEPSRMVLQGVLTQANMSAVKLYTDDMVRPYRLSSLYYVSVIKNSSNRVLQTSDLLSLQDLLKQSWNSQNLSIGSVRTSVKFTKNFSPVNQSTISSRLYYSVMSSDMKTLYASWERKVDITTKLNQLIGRNSTLKSKFTVSRSPETVLRVLYVRGRYTLKNKQTLRQAIVKAWQKKFTGSAVNVEIHTLERYTDSKWTEVTRVEYKVIVNGSSPDNMKGTPSYSQIQQSLKEDKHSTCQCVAKKLRKKYILKTTTMDTTRVKTVISNVWSSKNSGTSGVSVSIRDRSSRSKRAAMSDTPATRLVGNNGKEITPLEYTVSIMNQEPNPAFVDMPTSEDLATPMRNAGAELCNCTPKLAGTLTVDGETKDSEKPKLVEAVKEAFKKRNPDVDKTDLEATVSTTNKKDTKGKQISELSYELSYRGGDVEDLIPPSKLDWEQSLGDAGKTLHQTAPPQVKKEEDSSWKLPVIIVVCIAAVILIILIICYVIYIRKRSQKANLLKRGDQVTMKNRHDKEHFSDPTAYDSHNIAYTNPQYESKEDLKTSV